METISMDICCCDTPLIHLSVQPIDECAPAKFAKIFSTAFGVCSDMVGTLMRRSVHSSVFLNFACLEDNHIDRNTQKIKIINRIHPPLMNKIAIATNGLPPATFKKASKLKWNGYSEKKSCIPFIIQGSLVDEQVTCYFFFFAFKRSSVTSSGEAIKMDEYVPTEIPIIKVNVNSFNESPPKKKIANNANNVVIDVLKERKKVCCTEVCTISAKDRLFFNRFSRTRSITTIVSVMEYPRMVSNAAINGVPTSTPGNFPKYANTPRGIQIS